MRHLATGQLPRVLSPDIVISWECHFQMRLHNIFGPMVLVSKFNYCKNTDLGTMHIGYQLLQILIAFPSFGKLELFICQEQFSKYDKVSLGLIEMTHEIKQIYREISPIIFSILLQKTWKIHYSIVLFFQTKIKKRIDLIAQWSSFVGLALINYINNSYFLFKNVILTQISKQSHSTKWFRAPIY